MVELVLALYAEGVTDDRFLPLVIEKTCRRILVRNGRNHVEVAPTRLIKVVKGGRERDECILEAARKATIYDVLIVHSDADSRTYQRTRYELFEPGFNLVQQNEHVCKSLVPVIPVRAIEAWMLADYESLRKVLETNMTAQNLGLPVKARQVEAIARPKEKLEEVVRKVYADRPKRQRYRQINIGALYEKLAERVDLERLSEIPAYQQFVDDLANVLKQLNLV